jgi:tetratricopeptide (TPR) repeat protein
MKAARDVFDSRSAWKELPSDFLSTLAAKLNSVKKATEFALLCERTGILKNNIVGLVDLAGGDPDFVVGGVAATLTSYANAIANQRQFDQAKRALELVLLLKPRQVAAWVSMAGVAFYIGDCAAAVSWADRALAFKPDPDSKDPWERGAGDFMTEEGEKVAAEALGEPEMIGAWKQIREQMKAIKDACRE